jgi:Fuc2NAc and GlcNAc transferase
LAQPDVTNLELAMIGAGALLASAVVTGLVRRFALSHGLIDVPVERSSHERPTPRGGGVAIVLATTVALLALAWRGAIRVELLLAVAVGGIVVAAIGLADDRRRVSAGVRFAVHVTAAIWALIWLGGLPPVRVGDYVLRLGWSGYALGVVGIVWVLNLFNFMDGIDGIAVSEATFVTCCGALLAAALPDSEVVAGAVIFGAACLGFLPWNWPRARIFLGDVGSGYLGYVIAVLCLAAMRNNPVAAWEWLILGGVFFVDATVTLLGRLIRGERVYHAHRSHAYQRLARRWRSHRSVTLAAVAVNLLWLLPCALLAAKLPRYAAALVLVAFAPLAGVAVWLGAGRADGNAL